jgi:hypothetical protein
LPEATPIDRTVVKRILGRHGPQLAGIIGKTADRNAVRLISLLCDILIRNDPARCTELGDGITYFKIPPQANGLNGDAHVLRWVRKGKVMELRPFQEGGLEDARIALTEFMEASEVISKGRARAKAQRAARSERGV